MLPSHAQELKPNALLSSWKEVAAYLDVTVRTAQKWERYRGLPVQRLSGNRSRVYAHTDQIDRWLDSLDSLPPPETLRELFERFLMLAAHSTRAQLFCLVGVLMLSTAGWGLYTLLYRPGPPARYRVHGRTLVVLDADERETWRYTLDGDAAEVGKSAIWSIPVWYGDLDGDGSTEMLFVHVRPSDDKRSHQLLCFSAAGHLRWSYSLARSVRTRNEKFAPPFGIEAFRVLRLGPGKGLAVAVTGAHALYYPFQLALLSPRGQLLREYWHSGHIQRTLVVEAPGGGRDLLYLGGVSNAYSRATLVVLDPLEMGGASQEENPDYQLLDFEPPREVARILFPRLRVAEGSARFNIVWDMKALGEEVVVSTNEDLACASVCPTVLFHFSAGLKLNQAGLGDGYYPYLLRKTGRRERMSAEEHSGLQKVRYLTEPAGWLPK